MIGPPSDAYTVYEGPRLAGGGESRTTGGVWAQGRFSFTGTFAATQHAAAAHHRQPRQDLHPGGLGNKRHRQSSWATAPSAERRFSGGQATIGMWLDEERLNGVELSGFFLGKNSRQYSFSSDGAGNPLLSQPVIVGGWGQCWQVSTPGTLAAPVDLAGKNRLQYRPEFQRRRSEPPSTWRETGGFTFDVLAGVRYLYHEQATQHRSVRHGLSRRANFQVHVPWRGPYRPAFDLRHQRFLQRD